MQYRDKQGRFISKSEFQRREKISKALKKHYAEKRKSKNEKPKAKPKAKPKRKPKRPSPSPRPTNSKSKANKKKSKSRTKKKTSKTSKPAFKRNRKKTKVKSFPEKRNKANFFIADKLSFDLNRKINLRTENDLPRVEKAIETIKPDLIEFYKESKGRKRNKLMNLGYKIELKFTDAQGKNPTKINTTSYLPSFIVNKANEIQGNLELLIGDIKERFNEYLSKKGFGSLQLQGVEAEMQN